MEDFSSQKCRYDTEYYCHDTYLSGLVDYQERGNCFDAMESFFKKERAKTLIGYDKLQAVLSVGSGEGIIDCFFLSLCNNIKTYTCIEPDSTRVVLSKRNLEAKYPKLEVQCIEDTFENYAKPEEPLDAILFIHSIYPFKNNLKGALGHAMSLLKEGGKIVIIIESGIQLKMGLPLDIAKELVASLGALRETLKELKLNYIEEKMEDVLFDLSDEGRGYYGFLDVLTLGTVTRAEKENIVAKLKEACVPGTTKVGNEHFAFIITK